jgi:hypothetical protein
VTPGEYRRRITYCRAIRVTPGKLQQAADWCGGHMWAGTVIVPITIGRRQGEMTAEVGDWIVNVNGLWEVWNHEQFAGEWMGFQ